MRQMMLLACLASGVAGAAEPDLFWEGETNVPGLYVCIFDAPELHGMVPSNLAPYVKFNDGGPCPKHESQLTPPTKERMAQVNFPHNNPWEVAHPVHPDPSKP